jgi:hypothetical protein
MRNAVFPYARRGPDTKQTSDAIQAKISIRAFFISTTWGLAVNYGGAAQVAREISRSVGNRNGSAIVVWQASDS